ncbi:MAG: DUF456 domain-containing protein [Chloroflexi bacterium]|nr:DUF456 domain-containing protein [Chloroflexota bacterium]
MIGALFFTAVKINGQPDGTDQMALLSEGLLLFVVYFLMLLGMIGIIIPILPGVFLIWGGVAVYVWQTGFEVITAPHFVFISVMVLIAGTSDVWLPYLGAKKSGAAKRSYLLSMVGAIIGSFLLPVIGTIIGFVLGLFLGEYWKHQNANTAVQVSWGGLKGYGIATLIQFVVGVIIIALFTWQVISS